MRFSIYPWWLFIRLPELPPRLRPFLRAVWDVLGFYVLLVCFVLALSFAFESFSAHHPDTIPYLRARVGPFVRGWIMPYVFAWYLWWNYHHRFERAFVLLGAEILLVAVAAFLLPWAPLAASVVQVATWFAPWVILLLRFRRRHRFYLISEGI